MECGKSVLTRIAFIHFGIGGRRHLRKLSFFYFLMFSKPLSIIQRDVLRWEELFYSVSVVVWLERSLHWQSQVLGLILRQLGQFDVQSSQVRRGNFFIQLLGQHVDS